MEKLSKFDIIQIIQKTSHITIDASAYGCYEIKEIARQCKEQNCILTLQNANHFPKHDIINILTVNPNVELVILNPDNVVSQKSIDNLNKQLATIKKTVDSLPRKVK